ADDELVGYFFCSWAEPTSIEPIDAEIAQILADHTALAIRTARAIEAERAARRAADQLALEARRTGVELEAVLDAAPDAIHVVDEGGQVTGAVVMTRDVTTLHEMIEERARLDGALKTVRTVAHELNNKLSILTLYADTLPTLPPAPAADAAAKMTNLALDVAA